MTMATTRATKILRASCFRSSASTAEWSMMNSAVVMNFESKTLSHALAIVISLRLPAVAFAKASHSGVMKEILLGITTVLAEVLLCERSQLRRVQFSGPWKVLFAQDPLDPDVNRKRAQPLVGEEHHAISNL